jgi:DNA-binding NarL/FixJ family response regulator
MLKAQLRPRLRILIADDHELVRRGIVGIIRRYRHWKVAGEARDGQEAVEKARILRPDLVILDITMPRMDGLVATRVIREEIPECKILILTMHDSGQMARRILEAGARGYVLKSDMAAQLVRGIEEVSAGKLFLTPRVSELVVDGFLGGSKRWLEPPTKREIEIIRHLALGETNREVSSGLGISVRTVETHRARIMLKLGARSIADLVHYAIANRLVSAGANGRRPPPPG